MTSTESISIRQAEPADAPAVAELLGELGYPAEPGEVGARLEGYAGAAGSAIYVACDGKRIAGVISFHCIPLLHTDETERRWRSGWRDSGTPGRVRVAFGSR